MDILSAFMFLGSLIGLGLFVLIGTWIVLRKVIILGWRALTPRFDFSSWNRFWFTPADPTVLGLIRFCCGAITTYTVFSYSFMLQDFMGKDGWYDLALRLKITRTKPYVMSSLSGRDYVEAVPTTPEEKDYCERYKKKWGQNPPAPFPRDEQEIAEIDMWREAQGVDVRYFGLTPPRTEKEKEYVFEYMLHPANIRKRPPPAYPVNDLEKKAIFDYMAQNEGVDPRLTYSMGQPSWSLWFHVTDPTTMMVIHILIILVTFLFTIGFCTRITSVLTWITSLWYIHRNPIALFGVDTMMVILLLYLMIGPSGAALSVDRLIARWWSKAKPAVLNRWRALIGRPSLPEDAFLPAYYSPSPIPTVSANFAIRMLQVHLCIIYLASGLTKLQGSAWWNGTAVWGTFANFEFAPMAFEINHIQIYNEFLRMLGGYQLFLDVFLTSATIFTLVFEIGYAFLIWRPSTRWVFLVSAIILHGGIGLLMGLKTFALMMLVMNMSFLRREEVERFLCGVNRMFGGGRKMIIEPTTKQAPPHGSKKKNELSTFSG